MTAPPTLYEWAGGLPAVERLTERFYDRVALDPLLAPEFRLAFVSYLEWGSRLALLNSQDGAEPVLEQPMPRWGWGEVGGPYTG